MKARSKLPSNICLECLTKLNQFNEFFTTIHENQEILKIVFGEKEEQTKSAVDCISTKDEIMILQESVVIETHFASLEESSVQFEEIPESGEKLRKKKKIDRFDCYICSERLSCNLKFIQHFTLHHGSAEIRYSCFFCPKYVKKYRSYTRHLESHSQKRFTCDLCLRSFTQKITLAQHLNCHSNLKSYKCEACGKDFKQNSSLFKHRKQKHSGDLPSCSECQKTFVNNETLLQHMKSKHDREKDISCLDCSKVFASRSALIYHRNSHHNIDEESRMCKICKKKFSNKVLLTRHNKNFH